MIHESHKFVDHNYHGAPIRACMYCACTDKDPQAHEACKQAAYLTNQPEPAQVTPVTKPMEPQNRSISAMVASLSVSEIEGRIDSLKGELAALRVILKAAKAKDSASKRGAVCQS